MASDLLPVPSHFSQHVFNYGNYGDYGNSSAFQLPTYQLTQLPNLVIVLRAGRMKLWSVLGDSRCGCGRDIFLPPIP
jgi:hypothetical protein